MGRMCTWWGAGGRPGAGARGGEGELEHVELGAPKGNQGNHNYDLPATVDLNQYQAVAILREVSRDIRSGAVGEVLAAQIPEGLTPIEGPEGCRSY